MPHLGDGALERLVRHNTWSTAQLLDACRDLTPEQLAREFDIGLGSVQKTFAHIIDVMFRWADSIRDLPRRPCRAADMHGVPELQAALTAADAELSATIREVAASGRFDEVMQVVFQERAYRFTRGTAIVHVLTHGMHHRAQIFNMLRHLGVTPSIDGDVIEWELAERPGVAEPAG